MGATEASLSVACAIDSADGEYPTSQPQTKTGTDQPIVSAVTANIEVLAQKLFPLAEARRRGRYGSGAPRKSNSSIPVGDEQYHRPAENTDAHYAQSLPSVYSEHTDAPQRPWRLSHAGLHSLWEILEEFESLHIADLPGFHEFLLRRYVRSAR
jgi:hypothetical protein